MTNKSGNHLHIDPFIYNRDSQSMASAQQPQHLMKNKIFGNLQKY